MPVLSGERWRFVSPHLDRALELASEQRLAWLASLRGEDALAADVEALLEQHGILSQEGFRAGDPPPLPAQASLAGHVVGAYTLPSQHPASRSARQLAASSAPERNRQAR